TNKFAHNGKAVPSGFIFNLCTDIAEASALVCDSDCPLQCILSHAHQSIDTFVHHSNRYGRGGIPHPTVFDHPDVQLYNIAVLNPPLARAAVDLVVLEQNADMARKHAGTEPITKKGALDPG